MIFKTLWYVFSCSSYFSPFKISGNIKMMALKVKCHIDWEEKKRNGNLSNFTRKRAVVGLSQVSSDQMPEIRRWRQILWLLQQATFGLWNQPHQSIITEIWSIETINDFIWFFLDIAVICIDFPSWSPYWVINVAKLIIIASCAVVIVKLLDVLSFVLSPKNINNLKSRTSYLCFLE